MRNMLLLLTFKYVVENICSFQLVQDAPQAKRMLESIVEMNCDVAVKNCGISNKATLIIPFIQDAVNYM